MIIAIELNRGTSDDSHPYLGLRFWLSLILGLEALITSTYNCKLQNPNWKLSYITWQSPSSPQSCCRSSWVMIMEKCAQCVFSYVRSLQKPVFVATLSSFFALYSSSWMQMGHKKPVCVWRLESESKNEEEKGFNFWQSHENPIKPLHKETSSAFTRRPHACGNLSKFNYFGINSGSQGSVCGALLRERERAKSGEGGGVEVSYLVLQVWYGPHSCCICCNEEWGQVLKTV